RSPKTQEWSVHGTQGNSQAGGRLGQAWTGRSASGGRVERGGSPRDSGTRGGAGVRWKRTVRLPGKLRSQQVERTLALVPVWVSRDGLTSRVVSTRAQTAIATSPCAATNLQAAGSPVRRALTSPPGQALPVRRSIDWSSGWGLERRC